MHAASAGTTTPARAAHRQPLCDVPSRHIRICAPAAWPNARHGAHGRCQWKGDHCWHRLKHPSVVANERGRLGTARRRAWPRRRRRMTRRATAVVHAEHFRRSTWIALIRALAGPLRVRRRAPRDAGTCARLRGARHRLLRGGGRRAQQPARCPLLRQMSFLLQISPHCRCRRGCPRGSLGHHRCGRLVHRRLGVRHGAKEE